MSNVCEYVKWRGDLTLKQSKFNEIDALLNDDTEYYCSKIIAWSLIEE